MLDLKKISWSLSISLWFNFIYQREITLFTDPVQPHFWWLVKLLSRLSRFSLKGLTYSIDVNRSCQIYQGSYGLTTTSSASLVLPLFTPYEEDNFQSFVLPFIQFFRPSFFNFIGFFEVKYRVTYSKFSTSSFQVSPLQKLLLK